MNDLSKQQLILLALLVSFITSLATGIVTVSLLDQAPQSVTRTVSQVIEKTIQQIAPEDAAVGTAISPHDQVAAAVEMVTDATVRLQSSAGVVTGLGIVISADGVILTDKSAIAPHTDYSAVFDDGTSVPVAIVQSQTSGDIAFLEPIGKPVSASGAATTSVDYEPLMLSPAPSLGQMLLTLSGTSTFALGQGIVTETPAASQASAPIQTSIPAPKAMLGSPLFDMQGAVVGLRTASLIGSASDSDGAAFYPVNGFSSVIPKVK